MIIIGILAVIVLFGLLVSFDMANHYSTNKNLTSDQKVEMCIIDKADRLYGGAEAWCKIKYGVMNENQH